jgi:broad specificity phosphatase PhoE
VNPSTHLYLVRHGEVEERFHRVFGGRIDMGLSARGREHAAALAPYLDRLHLDAAYASPMRRVQETIEPFRPAFTHPVHILPDLREVDFGDWTGLRWEEVRERFGVSAFDWLDQLEAGGIQNGESDATFRARIAPCFAQIIHQHPGRRVGVFCHGGVIRMALSILLELPLSKFAHFEIDYASVTWIHVDADHGGRSRNEVRLLNFTPWRDHA